jgi:hypothetical protein
MNRFGRLLPSLALLFSLLITLVGCQKLFSEFTIDDSAFLPPPITVSPSKGLYTTEWGGQARFTIVLQKQPTSDVTIALASNDPSEGEVSPESVTFNQDDWKAPQTVTVTGVDDKEPDTNQNYKIVTSPAVSDDPTFNGKNPLDVELVNIDNETAGITAVPRDGLVTTEGGGQDTFTVVLNSKPDKEVTLSLVSDTPMEGTVSPETLVFTPTSWMGPQLVTVTGVQDEIRDRNHGYKINITSSSDDPNYARLLPISVAVTNVDDDSPGVSYTLVSGIDPLDATKLRTTEGGDTATFTVMLNARPQADVTLTVASDTVTEGIASPDSLTFTVDNWNAPQTVTVTGVDDEERTADGDQPYLIVLRTLPGDDVDYSALTDAVNVPVRNIDDDKPGFNLMLLTSIDLKDSTRLVTNENGTTATFSLALYSKPAHPVTIALSSSMESEGTVLPKSLTFTELNWQSPQIVSVTGVDDDVQDGSLGFFVRTGLASSEDPGYAGLDPPDVPVTNQDDDSANVHVILVKGIDPNNKSQLVTDESGSTATFSVALESEPTDDVTIPLSSSNTNEGVISPPALLFTRQNYRSPQTVTITGQNDDVFDGNQPFSINVGPAASGDPNYDHKFLSQVQVTNRDDDQAGVIVNPTSGLVTSESGKTDSFTIRLQSKPSDKVTINVSSSNLAEGKPNVNSVVFTPENWNANQTVVVTGVDDDGAQDGSPTYKIILDPPQSNDPNYKGKPDPSDVTVTNQDNDTAGVIVSPTSGLMTGENGVKATFTIKLASKPVGTNVTVKIPLSSSRPLEGSVSPSTVTFDALNWNSPQTVTVQGLNDDVADGPQTYTIITAPASSTDPNYFNLNAADVSVINIDDDSAYVILMPAASSPAAKTTELGGKATFTVVLASLPKAEVNFTLTSLDASEGTVSPSTLKFTPTNGKTPQTVTVTGLNDPVADGDQQYTVRLSDGSSADPDYNGHFGTDLTFVNVDDDIPGLDIVAPTLLRTAEYMAGTATFSVALRSQPTASVSVGVSSSNVKEGTVSPPTLTFTQVNWATPQTVTVTGVQDSVADGPQTYQVKLANASSADLGYNNKFGTQLDASNADDDMTGYDVIDVSGEQTTEMGGQVTFSVKLKSQPAGASTVTLGLKSEKPSEGIVSPTSLIFTTDDWNMPHPVTVTGVDDKKADPNVVYEISFMADPVYGAPAPAALSLTNINDDVIGVQVNSTVCATTPGMTATFTINLNSQPTANVTIALSSDLMTAGTVSPESVTFTPTGTGIWNIPQTVTVTGQPGTTGTMTSYNVITADASAPGETTGYNGYAAIADVMCTNTVP